METARTRDRIRQVGVVVAVVVGIGLGVTGDYGADGPLLVDSDGVGSTSLINPAGYAFFIWGLIYLSGLVFAAHQARPSRAADAVLRRVGWPAAVAYLGQGLWARAAALESVLPLVGVVVATSAAAVLALAWSGSDVAPDRDAAWRLRAPLALHAGWLTLATILTTTDTLLARGVDRLVLGPVAWSVVLVVAAGAIAATTTLRLHASPAYPAAVVWGLVGVVVDQLTGTPVVAVSAALAAAAVAAAGTRALLDRARPLPPRLSSRATV